ncbi:eukaryotic mitochondrial regulator protein-domain-containing protein [Amylostereum chailletii]|nr:eukaryotic mitochondrial regulator protein-domain-containing protein [Amylostereum chailletii]
MFAQLLRASARSQPWRAPRPPTRSLASSSTLYARAAPAPQDKENKDEEDEDEDDTKPVRVTDPAYPTWLHTVGKQFKEPHRARNWLSKDGPFPLNPSFKPPAPVSDAMRTSLYQLYMTDPVANSVRELAGRYHLSMKRVDAILRLKGLEAHWIKVRVYVLLGKSIQTGFVHGMEKALGIEDDSKRFKSHEDWIESRMSVVEADALDQVQGHEMARARYQRMFWEPVVEGEEPVIQNALERARADAEKHKNRDEASKSEDMLLGHHHDSSQAAEVMGTSSAGRDTMFVDIGGKFIDPKDRLRRMKAAERRAALRARRKEKKTKHAA